MMLILKDSNPNIRMKNQLFTITLQDKTGHEDDNV